MSKRRADRDQARGPTGQTRGLSRAEILAKAESHWREVQGRLASRQVHVDRKPEKHIIPSDTLDFLEHLYREPDIAIPKNLDVTAAGGLIQSVSHALRQAYQAGCKQGYIEGRVAGFSKRQAVSDNANRTKRTKRKHLVDGVLMTTEERDCKITEEVKSLERQLGADEAARRVATRHDLTDRRVRGIILEQTVAAEYLALVQFLEPLTK